MTWTVLHDACERQDTKAILARAHTNPEEALKKDDKGLTPLHILCWQKNPSVQDINALIAAFPQAVADQGAC